MMAGPVVVVSINQHQELIYAHVALSQGVVKLARLQVFLVPITW